MSKQQAVARVFITGESPLVEEYASACAAAGMEVTLRFNAGAGGKPPGGARRRARAAGTETLGLELTNISRETKRNNLDALDRALPAGVPILSASAATTVAEQSGWIRHPARLVGIAALPSLLAGSLVEIARTEGTAGEAVASAERFFAALGKECSLVQDSPGMVMPRILCMLVNEASFAHGERIARRTDIDTAMKLGTNYPLGPLEWGEKIGPDNVRAVLEGLHRDFAEERYRTAPALLLRGSAPAQAAGKNIHTTTQRRHR